MQRVSIVDKPLLQHAVPIIFTAYGNQKGNHRHFFSKGLGGLVTRILTMRPPSCVYPEFSFKLLRRRQGYLCNVAFQYAAALRNVFKVRHIFTSSSPAHTSSHNEQLFIQICRIEMSLHFCFDSTKTGVWLSARHPWSATPRNTRRAQTRTSVAYTLRTHQVPVSAPMQ